MIKRTHKIKYNNDCRRIQLVLGELGYEASLEDCQKLWEWRSEQDYAGWLTLPLGDYDLLNFVDEFINEFIEHQHDYKI